MIFVAQFFKLLTYNLKGIAIIMNFFHFLAQSVGFSQSALAFSINILLFFVKTWHNHIKNQKKRRKVRRCYGKYFFYFSATPHREPIGFRAQPSLLGGGFLQHLLRRERNRQRGIPLSQQLLCGHPARLPHNELHCETGSLIYVGFSADDLRVRPGIYDDTENRLMERLVHLILSVFRTRFSDSDGSDELIGSLLHAMVLLLNRVCNESHIRQPDLLYARRFIDENMNRKIDFTGLAKSMGMTFDLFLRSFKKKYGVSPKNYLIDLRLEKAKKMLEEPDRNCTQVALECGFSSTAQFSTMFREKYGITPKKYALEKKNPARSAEETP